MLLSVFICGFLAIAFAQPDVVSPTGSGYTWFVDDDNLSSEPPWCNSIQQAIGRASAGNDILVWPGNYSGDINFDTKEMIQLHAQDPNDKPVLSGKITLWNSRGIIIQNMKLTYSGTDNTINASEEGNSRNFIIENCDLIRSTTAKTGIWTTIDATITNCTFKNYSIAIQPRSDVYGGVSATISGCYFEWCDHGIFFDASNAMASGQINGSVKNCTFSYVGRVPNTAPLEANSTRGTPGDFIDDITIYVDLENNSFANHYQETYGVGIRIYWTKRACGSCPTFYSTPKYPSNYPNNVKSDGVLNAPGTGGYNVVVNGKTESGYDKLYIKEMNGTLITTVSGTKTNYKKWINTNRSVIVQFTSDGAVNYKGYMVTVE